MRKILFLLLLLVPVIPPPPILAQTTDRTINIDRQGRLELSCEYGSVVIRTWNRPAIHILARHDPAVRIEIDEESPRTVSIQAVGMHGKRPEVSYDVTVPTTLSLEIMAVHAPIRIEGTTGRIEATNVKGGVDVRGGGDFVEVSSVEGAITVTGTRGRVEATTVNAGVTVSDVVGPRVEASTVNGSITLKTVDTRSVEATTVNGRIVYDGALHRDGSYSFNSHNGQLSIGVPSGADADVTVSTFNGNFSASFPVTFRQVRGEQSFRFVLGSGGARLELQSFNGPIRLRRPGEQ